MWLFLKFEVYCWVSDDLGNMTLVIYLLLWMLLKSLEFVWVTMLAILWYSGEGKESSMWAECETKNWKRPRSEIDSVLHPTICDKTLLVVLFLGGVFPHFPSHIWSFHHLWPGQACHHWCTTNFPLQNRLTTTAYWLPCLWVKLCS